MISDELADWGRENVVVKPGRAEPGTLTMTVFLCELQRITSEAAGMRRRVFIGRAELLCGRSQLGRTESAN